MKVVIILFALVASSLAASLDTAAIVLKSESDNIGTGPYKYGYETSNGIAAEATGEVINAGLKNEAVAARGSFQYTGEDGVLYSVSYVADENGFQPVGAHLPVAS